jgi:hypothetical protein
VTDRATPSAATRRAIILALWALTSLALLIYAWGEIAHMNISDPDDALRLVQVRDLLAGQSWFDLTQYRINAPDGVPMHWSRLVDLPIALLITLFKPILGTAMAERVAMVAYPLALLLGLMFIVHAISRTLGLRAGTALLSVALLATSLSILVQFMPMRIDHHSAQIIFGGLAILAMVHSKRRDGRMGLVAGLAMASWLQISVEGLPSAVALGGVFAVRHLLRVDCWPDMRNYLAGLTIASALLLFGTHGPADAITFWCDSLSPAYLLPLGAATIAMLACARPAQRNSLAGRAMPLIAGGIAGGAAMLLTGRQCLAGPFDTLDPLIYGNWYLTVKEGMPITAQHPSMQAMILLPALLGLAGSYLGWRRNQSPEQRMAWASLIAMQIVTLLIAIDVMRAMSFAHLLGLPGNALLLARLMAGAQSMRTMPLRVLLSTGTMVMTPLGATAATAAALDPQNTTPTARTAKADAPSCVTKPSMQALNTLPEGVIMAPLDIGSHIIAFSHHKVVGTGHHRNIKGMKATIATWIADPASARPLIAATGARYVMLCRGKSEVARYEHRAPHGLAATLLSGKVPQWLTPLDVGADDSVLLYRIKRDAS